MSLIIGLLLIYSAPPVINTGGPASDTPNRRAGVQSGRRRGPIAPKSATPIGNPGAWVHTEDYPADALRNELEGIVSFRLTVGATGMVTACDVTGSSGTPSLDARTCELLRERARFTPATSDHGSPITGTYSNRVRWQIPRETPPEPLDAIVSYIVETDATITHCKTEKATGAEAEELADPASFCPKRFSKPYLDAAGRPVRRLVRLKMAVTVEAAPDQP